MVRKNMPWDIIPKDWDVVVLGEYSEISRGGSPRPIQDYLTSNCHGINWIKIGDVSKNSKYIFLTAEKIIPEGVSKSRSVFRGDLILSNSMSFGRPYILKIDGCIHDGWLVIQNYQSAFDKEYLYYCLGSEFTIQQYISMAAGSSVQNLNKDKVSAVIIAKPPIQEQTAIAEALSDIDSLISSLQKLIEKRKAIKQGAMQELLTGKKRLPGFNEEWEELNFAESAKLKARIGWQGLTTSEYLQSGYAYLITGTDFHNGRIKWETCHFVDEKRYKQDLNIQIKKHDILLTKDGTIGKVAYISNVQKPTTLNSGVFVIRPAKEDSFDPNFVYHILNSFLFDNFLAKLSAGSTINHLYQKDFVDFTFKAPSELVEQQAIAQVLSDMDSEIDQLEKKLAKYQQIKQGMMQELLTGRIRLV